MTHKPYVIIELESDSHVKASVIAAFILVSK